MKQSGFSLIEITIGMAIAGGAALGMASYLGNQAKAMNTLEFKFRQMEVKNILMGQVFTDASSCSCLVKNALPAEFPDTGVSGRLSTTSAMTKIGLYNFSTPNDCSTATIPRPIITDAFDDGIKASDIFLSDIVPLGSGKFTGTLSVEVQAFKKVMGADKKLLKFPVVIGTDPGSSAGNVKFSSCSITGDVPRQIQAALANANSHETRVCYRDDSLHNITASCPAGEALIACSGGEGDIDEDNEGSWIIPDYPANTCTLTIKKPRCVTGESWTEQRIIATCYQL